MAWSVTDHGTTSGSAGATLAKAVTANITVGSVIVVAVYEKSTVATGGSMTDDAGNTYTSVGATNPNATTANGLCQFFYSIVTTQLNSAQNVTYTRAVSGGVATISVMSATGGATTSILDTAVTATNTSGVVSTPTLLTSGTPSVAGELFIAMAGMTNAAPTLTQDTGNGWAAPPAAAAANPWFIAGNQVNSGTGTKNWQPSANKTGAWASIIIGLIPASPAIPSIWDVPILRTKIVGY